MNRLWPLLLSTIVAGGLGLIAPQIPGIATGFAIIWALGWRRQESAVRAIEERDGVTFYVEPYVAVPAAAPRAHPRLPARGADAQRDRSLTGRVRP